jgi:hypothetical protein
MGVLRATVGCSGVTGGTLDEVEKLDMVEVERVITEIPANDRSRPNSSEPPWADGGSLDLIPES